MEIREARPDELAAVVRLWTAAGLARVEDEEHALAAVASERHRDPELLLVAADGDGRLVGTVTGGFDGSRGWIRKMAVDPGVRRAGVGRSLVAELERRLAALGARRVGLLSWDTNEGGLAFWSQLGFRPVPGVVYATKGLEPLPQDDGGC